MKLIGVNLEDVVNRLCLKYFLKEVIQLRKVLYRIYLRGDVFWEAAESDL